MLPKESWVAKYTGSQKRIPGVYAMVVFGGNDGEYEEEESYEWAQKCARNPSTKVCQFTY